MDNNLNKNLNKIITEALINSIKITTTSNSVNENQIAEIRKFDFCRQKLSITEINKELTKQNKESIDLVLSNANKLFEENDLNFEEQTRILKRIVPCKVKSKKFSFSEINEFVERRIKNIENLSSPEEISIVADLKHRISIQLSINYLCSKLGDFETDNLKDITYFEIFIQLGNYYLENKEYEFAFRSISRASQLIKEDFEYFYYFMNRKIVCENYAKICFKEKKYQHFLHYEMCAFALEIIRDLTFFPEQINGFFYRKNNCFNLDGNDDIDIALKSLNLLKEKDNLLKEFARFIYDDLPIIYGIPIELLNEKVYKEFSKNLFENTKNYEEGNRLQEHIKKTSGQEHYFTIDKFVGELTKKYYDKFN